jgi:hypothetical protein
VSAIPPDTKNWTWVLSRTCPECGFDVTTLERVHVADLLREVARRWVEVLTRPDVSVRLRPDRWSAVLVSRTLHADRWWRAEPADAGEGTVRGLWEAARGADRSSHLDRGDRYVLARLDDGRVFAGLATLLGRLESGFATPRPQPLMVGWLSAARPRAVPSLDALRENRRAWAWPVLVRYLEPVWTAPEGSALLRPRHSEPTTPPWGAAALRAPGLTVPASGAPWPASPRAADGWLWPEHEAGVAWAAVAAAAEPCVLVTGWASGRHANPALVTHIVAADVPVRRPADPASPASRTSDPSDPPDAAETDRTDEPDTTGPANQWERAKGRAKWYAYRFVPGAGVTGGGLYAAQAADGMPFYARIGAAVASSAVGAAVVMMAPKFAGIARNARIWVVQLKAQWPQGGGPQGVRPPPPRSRRPPAMRADTRHDPPRQDFSRRDPSGRNPSGRNPSGRNPAGRDRSGREPSERRGTGADRVPPPALPGRTAPRPAPSIIDPSLFAGPPPHGERRRKNEHGRKNEHENEDGRKNEHEDGREDKGL